MEDSSEEEGEPSHAHISSEEQFWAEYDGILSSPEGAHDEIDDALRAIIELCSAFQGTYLRAEPDYVRCCQELLDASFFDSNREYVLRQLIECLLGDDDLNILHLAAVSLLIDGRKRAETFETMRALGSFPRLVQLIRSATDDDKGLHRILIELLFEMSRIQQLNIDDLMAVDDAFVQILFELIEQISSDVDHPYHSPVIGVLLVLNEQYMCLANMPESPSHHDKQPLTNRVLKLLSLRSHAYRTFGEDIVLVLNRESDLSPQLLILKLLYLLFTTPSTYEYFYTNDLYVIVDVFIRNLLNLGPAEQDSNLPEEQQSSQGGQRALVHTYLRVLCPLLKNTQIAREGSNYKRGEVRRLLNVLANRSSAHFAPVDETVIRLVLRCKQIPWLREEGDEEDEMLDQKLKEMVSPPKSADVAKKLLGMSISEGSRSALSVPDISAKIVSQDSGSNSNAEGSSPMKAAKMRPVAPPPRRRARLKLGGTAGGSKEIIVSEDVPPHGSGLLAVPELTGTAAPGDGAEQERGASPFADYEDDG